MSQDDIFQVEPPRKKSSGSNKLLIGLAIGCGGMMLLCCGGIAVLGWFGHKMAKEMISQDPVVVVEKTREITDVDIPDGFTPMMSMDMKVPFTGQRLIIMTTYVDKESQSNSLVFMQGDEKMGGVNSRQQFEMQMRQSIDQQGQQGQQRRENLIVQESEGFVHEVRGVETTFQIATAKESKTGEESGKEYWQVSGAFKGKSGPAFVFLTVEKEKMTREEIEAFIESIH